MQHSDQNEEHHTHTHTKSSRTTEALRLTTGKGNFIMKFVAGSLFVLSALTAGCVNSSTLQTAKALDPGSQRILVGGGYYASPSLNADASSATNSDVSLKMPYMELGYRRGIVDKVEL